MRMLKQVTAFTLLGLFAIPVFTPALHELLEEHDHLVCTAVDVDHLHDAPFECDLCDYLIGIKPFSSDTEEEYYRPEALASFNPSVKITLTDLERSVRYLRGPPRS